MFGRNEAIVSIGLIYTEFWALLADYNITKTAITKLQF